MASNQDDCEKLKGEEIKPSEKDKEILEGFKKILEELEKMNIKMDNIELRIQNIEDKQPALPE